MPVRYLDEQEKAPPQKPKNIGEYLKQEAPFVTQTLPDVVKGAVNKVRETTSQPILRFLANAGVPSARAEIQKIDQFNQGRTPSTAEKVGGVIADAGMMMAPTPAGKLGIFGRAAGAGLQGAAQHQAQNYAKTGNVDVGQGITETGATMALMGAGAAVEPALKSGAANYLQLLTRAPKRLERGMNPPTTAGFKQALEKRLFPILKGGYKEAEKRGMALQGTRNAERGAILDANQVAANPDEILQAAKESILSRGSGSRGLLPSQMEKAVGQLEEYRAAANHPSLGRQSEVVDKYAESHPIRMYHGTRSEFKDFKPDEAGNIYATTTPEAAATHAYADRLLMGVKPDAINSQGANIRPLKVSKDYLGDLIKNGEENAHYYGPLDPSKVLPAYEGISRVPGKMPGRNLVDLRKMADQNANFVQGKTPEGLDLASQEFRTAIENRLGKEMAGKPNAARYQNIKGDMAELAPVLEAFNEKAISNYSLGPELISTLLGASVGQPWLALAPAARRLPQVAPALYEVGRAAGSKTVRRAGKAALDLARATTYGVLRNEDQ